MTVVASARSRRPGTEEDGVAFVDARTLLAESDVVTVLTPLTPQTRHIIDAAALRAMKPTAYVINTARGGVVDESAFIDALNTGQIRGAALDVFENEPGQSRALDVPNLVLTRIASAGEATRDAMGILAIDSPPFSPDNR